MLFIIYLLKICLILHISKGCNNLIRITWEGVIMCAVLHGGCNNVCRITWGYNMDFSKWRPEILHEIKYLVLHNYFVFFGKRNVLPISFQSIVVYFRCLLLSKWITKKTWKMLLMQRTMTLLYGPKIESSCVVV